MRRPVQALVAVVLILGLGAIPFLLQRHSAASAGAGPVLRWANEGISDIYTLDPAHSPDLNARQAVALIFGGLVRFGPHFQVQPDVAERWDVRDGGRTYVFHLRHNVRFADGHLLTAQDVAYSLNRTLGPQFADQSGAYFLGGIVGARGRLAGKTSGASGIQVVDPFTLRIRLTSASGSFLSKLANPAGAIVPRWAIERAPRTWTERAFGTGPFQVSRWVHNQALFLVPNPHYYAGSIQIGGIEMPFIPEPLAAYKRYRAGGVDIMGAVHFPTEVLYDVQGRSDFHASPRLETVFLTLNTRRPPFDNPLVREAFARALDKPALVRQAYNDFARATNGMVPPGMPGFNPNLRGAGHDETLARHLLARAGFPGGRGLPAIDYPVDQDGQSLILASAIGQQWRRVLGADVHLMQDSHSNYLSRLQRLDYGVAVIDWTDDYPDPENFLSQQLQTGLPNNNGGWSNAEFDRLTHTADRLVGDDSRRLALYGKAEGIAMSQAAVIPLVNPKAGILLRGTIHGIDISGGYILVKDWSRVTVSG